MSTVRMIGERGVSPIGLGCAALSLADTVGASRATQTIRAAQRAGISLFDTAIAYTPAGVSHHNERLLHHALATPASSPPPFIATKGGHYRDGDAFPIDGRPQTLRAHCESSLRALGVDRIDLYFLHWPDPDVPIEESVGALGELRSEGKISEIGVSNVDVAQVRRARRAAPIVAVENRLSVFDQRHRDVVAECEQVGMAFLAYSPLGGADHAGDEPARQPVQRQLAAIANEHGILPEQTALAWLLALSPRVIPIVGASRPSHAAQAADAVAVRLLPSEIEILTEHEGRR